MNSLNDKLGVSESLESLQGIYREHAPESIREILGKEGLKKPLVLMDGGVENMAPTREILAGLESFSPVIHRQKNFPVSLDDVREAGAVYLGHQCDCLVVIGGGSTIDLGKLTGFLACNNIPWVDVFYNPETGRRIPLTVAVPTTPSGAESSTEAFVLDHSAQTIRDISRPFLIPTYLVLDQRYLEALPSEKILSSLADFMAHLVDLHLHGHEDSKGMEQVGRMIRDLLKGIRPKPEELGDLSLSMGKKYRSEGMSFLHGLCHVLAAHTGIGHDQAVMLFLPDFLRYEMDRQELDVLAQKVGWENEHSMLRDLDRLMEKAGSRDLIETIRPQVEEKLKIITGQSAFSIPAQADLKSMSPVQMRGFICEVLDIIPADEEKMLKL